MSEQINVNDFKNGQTFLKNNEPHLVLDSAHSKSGRGQAHVKVKAKNLITGANLNFTFVGGEKVEKAFVSKESVQFLYTEGGISVFMNMETFEQEEINNEKIKTELNYLVEETMVTITKYENIILGIELPKNIKLQVVEAPDAVKGDTVTNATKKVKLETGIEIDVPQFISTDEYVIVNTETGKYVSKA